MTAPTRPGIITFGPFEVDLISGRLYKHGSRIGLREKSFQVLALLLEQPGEVVTREQLRQRLWSDDVFVDFENNLNTAVARLREALGDSADQPSYIETLPRRGYRFVASASEPNPAESRRPTRNRGADEQYLEARFHLGRGTLEGLAKARQRAENAIKEDPEFALAHDCLAEIYWYMGYFGFMAPRDAFSTGVLHAMRALEIDHTLGETHALLGLYHKQLQYNWPEVDREMARALELGPASPVVRVLYAFNALMPRGRLEEAAAELKRAVDSDPMSAFVRNHLAIVWLLSGQYGNALIQARLIQALEPVSPWPHFVTGVVCREQGRSDEAIAELRLAADLSGESAMMLGWLGLALAVGGRTGEARALLDRLRDTAAHGYVPPTSFAWIHLGLREVDAAFEWLDRAIDAGDQLMMPIKSYRFLDPIRSDPRFVALLRKMNLG